MKTCKYYKSAFSCHIFIKTWVKCIYVLMIGTNQWIKIKLYKYTWPLLHVCTSQHNYGGGHFKDTLQGVTSFSHGPTRPHPNPLSPVRSSLVNDYVCMWQWQFSSLPLTSWSPPALARFAVALCHWFHQLSKRLTDKDADKWPQGCWSSLEGCEWGLSI